MYTIASLNRLRYTYLCQSIAFGVYIYITDMKIHFKINETYQ